MYDFIIDVDQPLFVSFADDTDFSSGQVNLIQLEVGALTPPYAGVGEQGHDGVVAFASALQEPLAERFHVLLGNGAEAGVLPLHFHEVIFQHNDVGLLTRLDEPIIIAPQR